MELAATLAVVALAAVFLARRVWRTFVPNGKAAGCGCGSAKAGCPAVSGAVRQLNELRGHTPRSA